MSFTNNVENTTYVTGLDTAQVHLNLDQSDNTLNQSRWYLQWAASQTIK